ncbi:DUF6643 family protein [Streptomyces sp. GC420]|uniref:DUF6643 family protein n=1 Tax=Streptomyces sp. GC420 TaxID=2697568 RepID=UPI001415032B|nr:DUF6643 family protein [Streptomyces sp. GC420]NBM14762.1 hypothetical protein [Streptomyces sp. GC420]
MTSPRVTYGGGYYSASPFPDTPIYDSLVAERGTPQIAPIRVPAAYDTPGSYLPALPAALPALPAAPSQPAYSSGYGYPQHHAAQHPAPLQQAPLQQAPAPYIPQQTAGPRGYPGTQPQQRPMGGGYEAMRPAAPRPAAPAPAPTGYQDPYGTGGYQGRGY